MPNSCYLTGKNKRLKLSCSSWTHSELIRLLFILLRTGFVFKLLLEVITVVIVHTYYCVFKSYYNFSSAFKYVQYVFFLFVVLSKTTIFLYRWLERESYTEICKWLCCYKVTSSFRLFKTYHLWGNRKFKSVAFPWARSLHFW